MSEAAVASEIQPLLRGVRPEDENLIFDNWLASYRDNNEEAARVPKPVYFSEQRLVVGRLLAQSHVLVACNPEDSWQVLGWMVVGEHARQGVLHYLYIKGLYRGFDITERLTEPVRGKLRWYTHHTPKLERVARSLGLTFNPYLTGVAP